MSWWPAGGLWRHRDFLNLWAAQIVSATGSRITRTALPVIAILSIDASPNQLAALAALSMAPGVVVGLLAGGPIDRSAKRRLLIASDLIRAALILTVPIAAWLDLISMAQLYVVAGLVGAMSALFQIADNAYLPVLIDKRDLVDGNSKLEASESIAEITGPGLAGVLIEALTGPVAVVIDAATYLWSAVFLSRIRAPERPAPSTERASLAGDIASGFRAALGHPLVRPLVAVESITSLSFGFFATLYMLFTLDTLALSPGVVGAVISVGGIGALLGTFVSTRVSVRVPLGAAMIAFLVICQCGQLLIPLASGSLASVLALLIAHQLIGDAFRVAYAIQAVSLQQTVIPVTLLGRVNATFHVVRGVGFLAGMLLAGPLASALGVRAGVWIGVSLGLLAPLALLLSPIRTLGAMPAPAPDDAPADSPGAPSAAPR